MKNSIRTMIICLIIAIFIWLIHTGHMLTTDPSVTFLFALLTGLSIWQIIFRVTIILISIALGFLLYMFMKKSQIEEYVKLKKAVDTSGEVIFITDREGIFTYVNPEFTRVYGFQQEEIIGKKTPRILKSGVMDSENYRKFWEKILAKNVVKGEIINKTKSDRLIDVESSANPILNDNDEIIGFLCVQRDITERKARERRLIESEKTARAMLNASEHPVYLVDVDGNLLSLNEAAMIELGSSLDSLVGKNIYDFDIFRFTDQDKKVKEAIQSKKKIRYEKKLRDKFYDITIYPLFDLNNNVSRLAVFNVDISSQQKAEQTIRQQNRFLHSVIEALDHPFFVIDVRDYKVKLANSAAKGARELGQAPCYALTHNRTEPCRFKEHICPLETIKKTLEPVVTEHVHYDKNGRRRNVEVHAYPIFDDEGSLIQMIEYTLDITDRKIALQEIEKLNEQLNKK